MSKKDNNDENYSWSERMKNETQKAFTYFNTYLNLGPNRTLNKTRAKHNNDISLQQLKVYSSKYHWVDRANQKDEYDVYLRNERLKQEQDAYFDKRLEQLDQYHQATDAVLGQLMIDLGLIPNPKTGEFEPNNRVNSTTVANSIQNLSNANAVTSKLALRFLGLPEMIQDTQEVIVDADVNTTRDEDTSKRYAEFTEAIMDKRFIDKQLDIINEMVKQEGNSRKDGK